MSMTAEHNIELYQRRIYYGDTDAGGIVYHANYLRLAEEARSEWSHSLDIGATRLLRDFNSMIIVKKIAIDYQRPVHLDDIVTIDVITQKIGGASVTITQNIFCHDLVCCHLDLTLVCINPDGKPQAWADPIKHAFLRSCKT